MYGNYSQPKSVYSWESTLPQGYFVQSNYILLQSFIYWTTCVCVGRSEDCQKQSRCQRTTQMAQVPNVPALPPNRLYESDFPPPHPSKGIKLIKIQRLIDWWQFYGQKFVRANRQGERMTPPRGNNDVPSPLKTTIRNESATSLPIKRHQSNHNQTRHRMM